MLIICTLSELILNLPALRGRMPFSNCGKKGVGVNVHYLPVYLHPYYQNKFGTHAGLCPIAESITRQILSLPIHPEMSEADVESVVQAVRVTIHPSAGTSKT